MGYTVGGAQGSSVALLECESCGELYETDERSGNDCPHCSGQRFDIVSTEPGTPWREQA